MALSYFEFSDANGAKRRCVCDIASNGVITFYTKVESGFSVSFPSAQPVTISNTVTVDWTTAKLVATDPSSHFIEFEQVGTSVGTTATEIVIANVARYQYLSFEVNNTGATAFTECQVQARYKTNGVWNPKTFGSAEYTTGSGKQSGNSLISIIEASGNLNALAANSSGWVEINASRYQAVRLVARTASGTTTATVRAIAKLL